ncbi:MAG: rRNA ((1518)-N(6)/adenine(1519)-N(6))-dimethyltransferase [Gammaproteobacteria bacterium]|jgi:16S rRNA (adenine1518-N6/adenine1519-N6)-dimethyltransferase|nr:rRNA ((1518)-N(6)/adenine(1519)-N(6))-dimethyltransferase [Gammaproteobacteria bacterium]
MQHFHARKRFGQHFLTDDYVINAIIEAVHPAKDEHWVEIGPGLGALTKRLLPLCGRLDVIEIDRDLAAYQQQFCASHSHFQVHQKDALQFDLQTLTKELHSLRLVGNLPYNITTPLLFHFFSQQNLIVDMYFMVQKEVSDRLSAKPYSTNYGRLSVMAQYYCRINPLLDIPPSAFNPKPAVNSAFIHLEWQRSRRRPQDEKTFAMVVQYAFNQRRKTVQNSLKSLLNAAQIRSCGIDPQARAQTLSVEDFIQLSDCVSEVDKLA